MFGVVSRDGKDQPLFLVWERLAISLFPLVFEDEVAAGLLLRVANERMESTMTQIPLAISCNRLLEECGLLGDAWHCGNNRRAGSLP